MPYQLWGVVMGRPRIYGHGTNARYEAGCREACCRIPHTAAMKQWRVDTERNGKRLVPAQEAALQIKQLRKAGWSTPKVAAELGLCHYKHLQQIASGRWPTINRTLAQAIEDLWEDICAPLPVDTRRWPIEPLKAAVIARYGSLRALGNTNLARNIHRHAMLSTQTAERYAESLDLHPTELWGMAWYEEPDEDEDAEAV